MRVLVVVMMFVCVLGSSCVTIPQEDKVFYPVDLVVESEKETIFEVFLDDVLILSNKVVPGTPVPERFTAEGGKHSLVVSADGHDKWQRTIGLISSEPQHYYVTLEKTKIRIPTIAR